MRATDADLLTAPWDGSVGRASRGRRTWSARTAATTPAARCAGRPLARAMPAPGPADVWECSHLGGDRFAANVVVLPHGFYYGQVPGDGAELVRAHGRGQVALPWLRGRAGVPPAGPGCPAPARSALGLLGLDDLPVTAVAAGRPPGGDVERWAVTMAGPDGPVVAAWRAGRPTVADRLTCRATHPAHSRTWHVTLLDRPQRADARASSSGIASSVAVSEPW